MSEVPLYGPFVYLNWKNARAYKGANGMPGGLSKTGRQATLVNCVYKEKSPTASAGIHFHERSLSERACNSHHNAGCRCVGGAS